MRFKNILERTVLCCAYFPLKAYMKYIGPRIEKVKGRILAEKIQEKGENVIFHGAGHIVGGEKITIGSNTRVGKGVHLNGLGGIKIGENCQISRNVTIYSANHDYRGGAIPYDNSYILKPVKIEDSVWIGMNVSILPGVLIGQGSIIGMNTVVAKNVEAYSIVAGSAQRCIGYRDQEMFEKHKHEGRLFGIIYPEL